MELNGLTRKRETHPSVVNVCVHSLLVTLRNDGVGVPPPDGGEGGYVVVPREDNWLTAECRSNTGERWAVLQRTTVEASGHTNNMYSRYRYSTPPPPARTSSF